jgi:hypothetical protein
MRLSGSSFVQIGVNMKQTRLRARVGALALIAGLGVQPAMAAPFCLANQIIPPQCIYYDAHQCQVEAAKQNAECRANPAELHLTAGYGKYCVVTSGGASNCNYTDVTSCGREASRQNGTCVEGTESRPGQGPNPFSATEGN